MQKFEFLQQPLLGELAMSWREEREKKMPFIVATYVYACSPRAAHGLRSDQNMFVAQDKKQSASYSTGQTVIQKLKRYSRKCVMQYIY